MPDTDFKWRNLLDMAGTPRVRRQPDVTVRQVVDMVGEPGADVMKVKDRLAITLEELNACVSAAVAGLV